MHEDPALHEDPAPDVQPLPDDLVAEAEARMRQSVEEFLRRLSGDVLYEVAPHDMTRALRLLEGIGADGRALLNLFEPHTPRDSGILGTGPNPVMREMVDIFREVMDRMPGMRPTRTQAVPRPPRDRDPFVQAVEFTHPDADPFVDPNTFRYPVDEE